MNLIKKVYRWHRQRAALQDLRELPDYLLKDIGICRCELECAVRGDLSRRR
jgi:uncharacterized protein YjiS (DUF1127 family)